MPKNSSESNELTPLLLETDVGVISGLQRAVRPSGETGNAPLTLVLHAAGGGARSLARLSQLLELPGQLVIPDLNGYNQTNVTAEAVSPLNAVEQHLLVISTLVDKLRHPQQNVVLIGHSMGGFLCLKAAVEDRFPITALAIVEPVAFSVLDSVVDADARAEDLNKVMALDSALKAAGNAENALADFIAYWGQTDWASLPASMREGLLTQVKQIGTEALAVAHDKTPTDNYLKLQLPVLLMQGANTQRPAAAVVKRMADLLPQVEVEVIEGAGHMGPVQQPAEFATAINRFLSTYS